jgi:hypothetical protein
MLAKSHFSTYRDLRHDEGDRLAMSGDDKGLAALDRVEQAGRAPWLRRP